MAFDFGNANDAQKSAISTTDDPVVKAKEAAAEKIAVESSMRYELLKGSDIMNGNTCIEWGEIRQNTSSSNVEVSEEKQRGFSE